MNSVNENVLGCFWLPPQYYNTSVSGANMNTIKYVGKNNSDHYNHEYFEKVTLHRLLEENIPYSSSKKLLPKSKSYSLGFRDIVNDALRQIRKGRKGYVFTIDQLREVLRFIPDVKVSYDDDIYFLWENI